MRKLLVIDSSNTVTSEYALENQCLRSMMQDVQNELDRMSAPSQQGNGYPYNPVGRLRKLNAGVVGELSRKRIAELETLVFSLREQLRVLT